MKKEEERETSINGMEGTSKLEMMKEIDGDGPIGEKVIGDW